MKPCPECGSTARRQEPGEFALIGITGGVIQLHTDAPNTTVAAGCYAYQVDTARSSYLIVFEARVAP